MCGRYTQTESLKKLLDRFGFRSIADDMAPRYNIAPSQKAPVVVLAEAGRVLKNMTWGLIPFWVKELAAAKNKIINARSETLDQKPTFRKAYQSRRCLVLADGFYEWQPLQGQKSKQPMRITLKDEAPFAFAGLYEVFQAGTPEELHSFTIVTTEANRKLNAIHNRMPVILRQSDEALWLDLKTPIEQLQTLFEPYPPDETCFYPVSPLVNSPKNDVPECIQAIGEVV